MMRGISKESYDRLMTALSAQQMPVSDKFKKCLGIIDKECRDLRIYVWVSNGHELVPVYPKKGVADFEMLQELAEGMFYSETIIPSSVGRGTIYGEKICAGQEGISTLVLIEKWKKGMLPAGPFNPYHDIPSVMDVIRRVCSILKFNEQFEELKKRSNILELPDKFYLLEDINNGASVSVVGIVSMADADAVLDASGYYYVSELLREWVVSIKELAGDGIRLFYNSDSSFIVGCVGSIDEGSRVLRQLPERLSNIRMVKIVNCQIITLTAEATVVVVPVDEMFRKDPSGMLRKAARLVDPKVPLRFLEESGKNPTNPAGGDIFDTFDKLMGGSATGSDKERTEESA